MEDQLQALRYGDAMRACVSTIKSIVIIKMVIYFNKIELMFINFNERWNYLQGCQDKKYSEVGRNDQIYIVVLEVIGHVADD